MSLDPRFTDWKRPESERATLVEFLRRYRLVMEMKCADLDAAQLASRSVPPYDVLARLRCRRGYWFRVVMAQSDVSPLYWLDDVPDADWLGAVADPAFVDDAGAVRTVRRRDHRRPAERTRRRMPVAPDVQGARDQEVDHLDPARWPMLRADGVAGWVPAGGIWARAATMNSGPATTPQPASVLAVRVAAPRLLRGTAGGHGAARSPSPRSSSPMLPPGLGFDRTAAARRCARYWSTDRGVCPPLRAAPHLRFAGGWIDGSDVGQ